MTDANKLFADICKRGCIIETSTKYEYATKDLPKCLILVDENFPFGREFVIKSIIPNDNLVIFRINYAAVLIYIMAGRYIFRFSDMDYARNLDFITNYVYDSNRHELSENHFRGEYFDQLIQRTNTLGNISNYEQILKNKMIENLTELYLIKFMYLTSNIIYLPEIKIVIVEILFKLDKWNNLEISS